MFFSHPPSAGRSLAWALIVSALVHAVLLFVSPQRPEPETPPPRLEARLGPLSKLAPKPETAPAAAKPPTPTEKSAKAKSSPRLLTTTAPSRHAVAEERRWSAAEKADMNRFLDEQDKAPRPSLAERSLAMARDQAKEIARQDETGAASLELRPNAAPPDPFSLSMYVEGLLKRLNRSAGFVKNDPRAKGVKTASVQFKINPDGSLKSFVVVNEADQAAEIAFIRSVVEQAVPFAPFPADIDKSARSLTMTICIRPAGSGGGFGFSRASGRHC